MKDLSILIPSRNEEFLQRTIQDIEEHIEGNTEILWEEDVEPIGQRALTNKLAQKSTAKYLMKVDAHSAFSQGFDVKMIADMEDNRVLIPAMLNLYAYDWVCEQGHRTYQSKISKCPTCGQSVHKEVIWQPKHKPVMTNGCFDTNAVFQWNDPQPEVLKHQTMCIQGAGFMVTRENYWKWNLCDESFGSWGSHGVEISIKTWQNGGEVWATRNAWMAHLYRAEDEFPYQRDMEQVKRANEMGKKLLTKDIAWLVEKFNYPADWDEEKVKLLT